MPLAQTVRFQQQNLIRVGNADRYLLLAPEHGGRLVRWVEQGQDMLYWPATADWSRPARIRGGNPLLFPFIGRHFVDGASGRWRDADGNEHELAQHGFARELPFQVTECDASGYIVMTLTASAETRTGYPFDFRFEAGYRLEQDGLRITLSTENTGAQAMPYYAGHHFYFAVPCAHRAATELTMPPAVRARQLADGALGPAEPGAQRYRLDDPSLQDTFHVLQGRSPVTLSMPPLDGATRERTLRLSLEAGGDADWHTVTTWTESPGADFFCVEPWLGLPNAIHHGHGLRWLAPGATETAACEIRLMG